jgi:hypothetical protein
MLNPFLKWSALALGAVLVGQASYLAVSMPARARPTYFASWQYRPESLEAARKLADQEVLGQVVRVRRADDLTTPAQGEPGGVDRIPVEAVTFRIEKSYRGGKPETIEVFHTGSTSARGRRQAPTSPPPGIKRPNRRGDPTDDETRTTWLEGDPPYQQGERYLLLLANGPTVKVDGKDTPTKRPVSPEGRYRVRADGQVEPVSNRAEFATRLRGRHVRELEAALERPQQ